MSESELLGGIRGQLWIVTATTNPKRAAECFETWVENANRPEKINAVVVWNNAESHGWGAGNVQDMWKFDSLRRLQNVYVVRTEDYLGAVPALGVGLEITTSTAAEDDVIACFHDDLRIALTYDHGWDLDVMSHFSDHPECGLAGFFGAYGLGRDDIYKTAYDPMQLVRQDCISNMKDAEAHGVRETSARRVAVLDGFSQIMRAPFARDAMHMLKRSGIKHHAYDAALGALAARHGFETWMIPVECRHLGGQTAVGDPGYQDWARERNPEGDQGFWKAAHEWVYKEFMDVLPIRIEKGGQG
jgi:hypothetical protein